jgi:hypothetical protein
MNEVAGVIRKAIYTALNGNVSYNSVNIPIFDEAPDEAQSSHYILFSSQTEDDATNNARFVTEGDILLDIVTIHPSYPTKKVVESISDTIMGILTPTVTTRGITLPSGFSLTLFRRERSYSIPMLQSSTGKVIRKILRYSFRIQQN